MVHLEVHLELVIELLQTIPTGAHERSHGEWFVERDRYDVAALDPFLPSAFPISDHHRRTSRIEAGERDLGVTRGPVGFGTDNGNDSARIV